jgi:calcium channel MID1
MLPPRLSPLQSRLLAYIVASYFLLVASTCFGSFANAAELQTAANHDDQPTLHAPLHEQLAYVQDDTQDNEESGGYAPDFNYFDRSILGRQAPQVNELLNNEKKEMDISPGNTVYFTLKKRNSRNIREDGRALDALEARGIGNASGDDKNGDIATNEQDDVSDDNDGHELRKRQAGSQIWITANTCRQPLAMENITQTLKDHPQLVMYISADSRNQKPGPASTDHLATDPTGVLFDSGYANFTLQADSDVYIGLSAPTLPKELIGTWHFELAASFDGPYHSYNGSNPFLFKIDSDSESALFVTYGLSDSNRSDVADRWRENDPMRMYAFAAGNGTGGNGSRITGLEHSFCALKDLFNETSQLNSTTSITTQFGGGLPKSRFHISGLESNQTYNGFLVVEGSKDALELPGVGTVRGGGKVFQQFTWTTKAGTFTYAPSHSPATY